MRRSLFSLLVWFAAGPALGAPLSTDDTGCGGNAYSSAEVVEGRAPRRGPLIAMPDTLCADLAAPPDRTRIEIYGVPGLSGGGYDADGVGRDGLGAGGDGAPYERRLPRRPRRDD
ncbi:hypothetical protein [Methylobacterium sp. J-090]|uniref:hypothetical protein n=1 Tax=Methylobacterium sp. J-090 TaxID=2836666 RepID=UPI001FBB3CB4|nr:hypothetical protein [Methylobacterium sp. J-090]MCJ2081332.1 hypothetical protein [Methylobacterium sp. J-090]